MENIAPEDLATIEEAAEILRVPVATLRHWRKVGKAPRAIRFGKRIRFVRAEVETFYARAFAEQNEQSA